MRIGIKYMTPLLVAPAAVTLAIVAAPVAAAANPVPLCTAVGITATQCQTPGNVQINDSPPVVDYGSLYPYWGDGYGPFFYYDRGR